jgi:hypothetical protein
MEDCCPAAKISVQLKFRSFPAFGICFAVMQPEIPCSFGSSCSATSPESALF